MFDEFRFCYDCNLQESIKTEIQEFVTCNSTKQLPNSSTSFGTCILESKQSYTILEKFVFDFVNYYSSNHNIGDFKNGDFFVEFWCKDKPGCSSLHIDKDEHKFQISGELETPVISLVSYFSDNACPTILTDVDHKSFKYKTFGTENSIGFSIPKEHKSIAFNGSHYHGVNCLSMDGPSEQPDRLIVAINIWKTSPEHIESYVQPPSGCHSTLKAEEDVFNFIKIPENNVIIESPFLDFALFNRILYEGENVYPMFQNLISDSNKNYMFKTKVTLNPQIALHNKYGHLYSDIVQIRQKENTQLNRFYQRFTYQNIITPDIGKWIIIEAEKYAERSGWTLTRHGNYPTTDIPVANLLSVKPYFDILFETSIANKIKSSYRLHADIELILKDVFVVKYTESNQSFLEMHRDGSFISFNILLNNASEFEGGGTCFEDNLIIHLQQGDMAIHSGLIKHSGLPVLRGTRYILVGFVNLNLIP